MFPRAINGNVPDPAVLFVVIIGADPVFIHGLFAVFADVQVAGAGDDLVNAMDKMFKFESAMKFDSKERGIRDKVIKGKIYAFSFSKKAWEERARVIKEENIEIEFVEIEKLLIEEYGGHFRQEGKKEAKKQKPKKIRPENLKITVIELPKKQKA